VKRNIILVGAIIALILFLDQLVKIYIKTHFEPGESLPVFGNWFILEYIENQGMAFGTTFGSSMWHKLALSLFRIAAITGIAIYWYQQSKKGVRLEMLIAIGLILAGALGNLIDSMFYDFIFPYDPCMGFNHLAGSGIHTDCGMWGEIETRHTGFLFGNVVDMFKFQATWPQSMPWLGGKEVFPAIWNLADASITTGVVLVFIRQRHYFPKEEKKESPNTSDEVEVQEESELEG
jgi:signal peptidase II